MKKMLMLCVIGLLMFSLQSSAASAAQKPAKTFQLGHVLIETEDSFYHYFAVEFAKRIHDYSKGSVEIDIVGNSQLGVERDMIEGMQIGTIDMAIISNMALGPFVPQAMLFDLPYVFTSYDNAKKVVYSDVVKPVDDAMASKGLVVLSRGQGAFRHAFTRVKPIRELEDFKGLKIRVPENALYMDTYRALGANALPMSWSEVFTALQQNTIDGAENAVQAILNERFYEAADYLSGTYTFMNPVAMIISGRLWNTFSQEEKDFFIKAAKEAAAIQWDFVVAREQAIFKELADLGMKVNQGDVNIDAFKKAVLPVYDKFRDQIGSDLIDAVLELTK
ncbi:TRAP transporter substrate-binding protein [Synergistaceae bacterium OttesenSCG-928-I11]|nr:TRAP transporter substrate-binding protein [Synergistaceae bacterium OttesenSCG-928-I11]